MFSSSFLADLNDVSRVLVFLVPNLILGTWMKFSENINVAMAIVGETSLKLDSLPDFELVRQIDIVFGLWFWKKSTGFETG